jgi:SagB-type dehydrogenase family enzyme
MSTKKIDEILRSRRSIRFFKKQPISLSSLGYLLWASTGIQRIEQNYEFRTAPSAGALYPIETYLVINNIDNLETGIYHYNIQDHALDTITQGNFRDQLCHAVLDQKMVMEAAALFIWTSIFQRSKWKYGQRAYRYIYLDAGHIAENLALSAVGIGLGTCQIGALYDDDVNVLLKIDGTSESVIYMSVVGIPK